MFKQAAFRRFAKGNLQLLLYSWAVQHASGAAPSQVRVWLGWASVCVCVCVWGGK